MGAQKSSRKQVVYVNIKNGKFFIQNDPEPYDELVGRITSLRIDNVNFKKDVPTKVLKVALTDEEGTSEITLTFDNISTTNFIKFLKNADLTEEVSIIPIQKEEDGVKKKSILIQQNGKFLKSYYTKDDPKGLPQLKQTKFKGEVKWDNGDQLTFLENVIKTELAPQLVPFESKGQKVNYVAKVDREDEPNDEVINDDLPF